MSDTLSADILARYGGAQVPRYTSYPTAPHFSPAIGATDYEQWLGSLAPSDASLYLHIPFCRAMCWYCACHTTVAAREAPVLRYLDCLRQEIDLIARYSNGSLYVRHLHFGGGTPTLMPPHEMHLLMQGLRASFTVSDAAEIAIEIDPRTLTARMAEALGSCGFNRASLGVQSFDPEVQRAINRVQSFDETATAVRSLRANGVMQVNFDLIYGLPHQTVASCLDTVQRALELKPDRLAVFGYAHVPGFKLHQRKIEPDALPDSEARFAQSRAIADALRGAGYVEIGLDHFALPGDPLAAAAAAGCLHRNFQGYTTDGAGVLIGLGASSIGRLPQGYVQNEVRIPEYQRAVAAGRLATARGCSFSDDDRLRAAVIERLMCDQRVDLGAVCRELDADPNALSIGAALNSMVADGLVKIDGRQISVSPHARPLIRSVAATFDAYLPGTVDRHSKAV